MGSHDLDTGDTRIRYTLEGEGRVIICAHGFPDCERSFRLQVPALVSAGFCVVCPTMRAYAPSSPSRSRRYDSVALASDLIALADAVSPTAPVDLLGHDWGAVAAYAATHARPQRFRRLVTAAVPHLRVAAPRWLRPQQLRKSWYMGLFQLNGVAEKRVLNDDMALIDRLWRDWSPGYACPPEEMRRIKDAIRPHVGDVLAYYRALRKPRRDGTTATMARTQVPAMYVHGIDDGCVGIEMTQGIARAYDAGLAVHHISGAGHFVHIEQPERFNELLLRFLADD